MRGGGHVALLSLSLSTWPDLVKRALRLTCDVLFLLSELCYFSLFVVPGGHRVRVALNRKVHGRQRCHRHLPPCAGITRSSVLSGLSRASALNWGIIRSSVDLIRCIFSADETGIKCIHQCKCTESIKVTLVRLCRKVNVHR